VLARLREEIVATDFTERAAREQELRRQQRELERLQARLDVRYDDRLDGRIDVATYDRRAKEVKAQEQRIRQRMAETERVVLLPASETIDPMAVTSGAAERFL
jgi:hypothetical protein